jgi:carbonic anhydrase/acetyltransferase-like protein (isoleucine patch superfamily)
VPFMKRIEGPTYHNLHSLVKSTFYVIMTAVQGRRSALFIAPNATVTGDVLLDEGVSIWFGAVIRGDRDAIVIGADSNIQDNAVVHGSRGFPVRVGTQVSVGHGAILHGCQIDDRVLVGMGAILMYGSVVGEGSLIGAGAVVTEGTRIPPHSLVLGMPGRVIRETTPQERESIVANAVQYRTLAGGYIVGR